MRSLTQRYLALLISDPLKTKLVSSFVIFGLSEVNAQLLAASPQEGKQQAHAPGCIKWKEVVGFACLAFYNAPAMHAFFGATAALSIPARVLLQLCSIDWVNFSIAITVKALVKGASFAEAVATSRARFLPTLRAMLTVWPPIHVVIQQFVPVDLRVLAFNLAALAWNTYLGWSMRRAKPKPTPELPRRAGRQH